MPELRIEPFDKRRHQRASFECGASSLDDFIRKLATQYEKRKLGQTFVAVPADDVKVVGFYTLSASAVAFDQFPQDVARKLPMHPLPAILLARLAVDRSYHGQRVGELLLLDALQRALELSKSLGVFAVEVLALNESAKEFYGKYGFNVLLDDTRHMYLPINSIEQAG